MRQPPGNPPSSVCEDTLTSPSPHSDWAIGDEVVRLRQVGTDKIYPLHVPKNAVGASAKRLPRIDMTSDAAYSEGYILGSDPACHLCIADPKGRVSKQHARVYYANGYWHVLDLKSKNGMSVDGMRQLSTRLSPGVVLTVGSVQLIAESTRLVELRCYLSRILGWGWDNDEADQRVERALQTVRASHLRREALWLQSEEDTVQVAADLHRLLFDGTGELVLCNPKRKADERTARSVANQPTLREAVAAARGGTVCVRASRLPAGFEAMLETLRSSEERGAHVIVCDDGAVRERPGFAGHLLVIPPVRKRSPKERENVVREYFADAMKALGTSQLPRPEDRAWVLKHSADSLEDIAKGAPRILALRIHGSVKAAAEALSMAFPSLFRWVGRRGFPAWLDQDAAALTEAPADEPADGESAE